MQLSTFYEDKKLAILIIQQRMQTGVASHDSPLWKYKL